MGKSMSEKNEPTDEQMYSALSFFVMLVVVGVPLWWKTTEVYRVNLPYSEIDRLHELNIKIQMNVHVATIDDAKGNNLINDLKNIFLSSKIFSINFKQHFIDKGLLGSSKTLKDIEKNIKHPNFEGSLQLFEIPGLSRFTPNKIVLGQNRTIYFSSDTGAITLHNFLIKKILKEDSLVDTILEINLPIKNNLNVHTRHKIPLSNDFDILFTFLNSEPDLIDVEYQIPKAVEEYINPFIHNLNDLYNFHIKSQWLYFVNLQVQPKFVNYTGKGPHFALSAELLPQVITPLEKKLASHVSKYPCLNFVLYVPPCSSSPLYIYTKKGFHVEEANAFISPKWGGIQIFNPDRESCLADEKVIVKPDNHYIMSVFLQQFRLLLGIPGITPEEETIPMHHIRLWEKDSLLRERTVDQLTSSKLTLQSLSKLLKKINNIVINDQVGNGIHSALENINNATKSLEVGNLLEAYLASKKAFIASEKAFTDPSLLALLYFPDDQKYAVYIPLFLPVMIPVLISLKHITHWVTIKLKPNDAAS